MPTRNTRRGFTIVELLIVIVVIGILAAITIVAYNGIQQRAHNQQTVSAAREYATALMLYGQEKGSYPSLGVTCLGTYPTGETCHSLASTTNSAQLMNLLKPYLGNKPPQPALQTVGEGKGLTYNYSTGYGGHYFIIPLEDVSSCSQISGLVYQSHSTVSEGLRCYHALPPL